MSRAQRLAALIEQLRVLGVDGAIVGGIAVSILARDRFTWDIDVAVAVESEKETEELARAMQRAGYVLLSVVEQEARGVVATLRFAAPEPSTPKPEVDLICATSGIETEIVAAARPIEIARGVRVPVARAHHLIAMKILAARPGREQDIADLRALLAISSEHEIEDARQALRLIEQRGFHRGKDLLAEFESIVGEFPGPSPR